MSWYDDRTLDIGDNEKINPFWHCFGANACQATRDTVLAMLRASRTALLPVNTHDQHWKDPIIGAGDVRWADVQHLPIVRNRVPCLNVNLRTTAAAAVDVTRRAFELTGISLLKLEVLQPNMTVADDRQVTAAARTLAADGFRVMPLVTDDPIVVRELADIGCPVVRVQGSPIGSGRGIANPTRIVDCVDVGVPIILDCGIGSALHVQEAFALGCEGFLVDYLLFKDGDPITAIRQLRQHLDRMNVIEVETPGSHGDITPIGVTFTTPVINASAPWLFQGSSGSFQP